MNRTARFLTATEAARRLGVSTKALRLYEARGMIAPQRTAAGWRVYGPQEMARAAEIVALRGLGLSLSGIGRVIDGDGAALQAALLAHEAALVDRGQQLDRMLAHVRSLRRDLAAGRAPEPGEIATLLRTGARPGVAFELPWPWGGEWFELAAIGALTHIVGPLGCGKTRLAKRLAETLPGAVFLGLDRLADPDAAAEAAVAGDPALRARLERSLADLTADGAAVTAALRLLVAVLEADGDGCLIVDMLEQGLDHATQEALIAFLRRRRSGARPLVFMTRSSAILDLDAVTPGETIIFCPANHSPPMIVEPRPGAPGYEAVAMCLATPEVRARTEGVIAVRTG